MPQPSITKIRLKIAYLKFHSIFTGANELIISCAKGAVINPLLVTSSLKFMEIINNSPRMGIKRYLGCINVFKNEIIGEYLYISTERDCFWVGLVSHALSQVTPMYIGIFSVYGLRLSSIRKSYDQLINQNCLPWKWRLCNNPNSCQIRPIVKHAPLAPGGRLTSAHDPWPQMSFRYRPKFDVWRSFEAPSPEVPYRHEMGTYQTVCTVSDI